MSVNTPDSQSFQTLDDWLYYIEQSHPIHQIELGLNRVHAVAERAALQQLPGRSILIAGTNGKGTTARCLEKLLQSQGYSTGVYSSPHLLHFRERLRINDQDVCDADWVEAFRFIDQLRGDIELTYFEFTTLASFYLLRKYQPDFCLIEVGLGGRLDATNIITPDASIITTIDLDHQDWLGTDRDSIGREKAGIFRHGTIAVVGELSVPQSVLDVAAQTQSQLSLVNRDYTYQQYEDSWQWTGFGYDYVKLPYSAIPVQNMATSLATLAKLNVLPSAQQVSACLPEISLAGRMQWLQQQPDIIVDVAHNPQSALYLAQQLKKISTGYKRIIAFAGMLKDKDIRQSLQPLTALFDQWHLVSLTGTRGATARQLAEVLESSTAEIQLHNDVTIAYHQVRAQLQKDELLVVFGSFITVSAVLAGHNREAK